MISRIYIYLTFHYKYIIDLYGNIYSYHNVVYIAKQIHLNLNTKTTVSSIEID